MVGHRFGVLEGRLCGRDLAGRPDQPPCVDRKTGERVELLFMYRARAIPHEFINQSIIPTLCRKAGVARSDVRGNITSHHRARATIASQLVNSRDPMSLFELQARLGHGSPVGVLRVAYLWPLPSSLSATCLGRYFINARGGPNDFCHGLLGAGFRTSPAGVGPIFRAGGARSHRRCHHRRNFH